MFPHCGTGASLLQLSFSLLAIVKALELSNPPITFFGDSLNVLWTVSPNDPKDFDLKVGFCNTSNASLLFDQPGIDARASFFRNAIISLPDPSGLELPAACFVRAFDSETGRLLDSSPVDLISTNFPFSPSAPVSATTVSSTLTNASVIIILSSSTVASALPTTVPSHSPTVLFSVSTDFFLSTVTISTTFLETSPLSKATSLVSPESTAVASPTVTANQSSLVSQNSKRPVGPLVGEVLGSVFALLMLSCLFIALCIWRRRRHRRYLKNKYPFVSDETNTGFYNHMAAGETVDTRNSQSNQRPTDLVTSNRTVYLEEGDSVGNARVVTGNETGSK